MLSYLLLFPSNWQALFVLLTCFALRWHFYGATESAVSALLAHAFIFHFHFLISVFYGKINDNGDDDDDNDDDDDDDDTSLFTSGFQTLVSVPSAVW